MNKTELIEKVTEESEITKSAATLAVNAVFNNIASALGEDTDKVAIAGFGTFARSLRKARKGVNPQTGKTIEIAATNVVRFKPAKKFKDTIN